MRFDCIEWESPPSPLHCEKRVSSRSVWKRTSLRFDLEGEVLLLEAHDGARIGCRMGSFAFGLTVQDPYEVVSASVARLGNGSCIKTATDDVLVPIKVDPGDK